MLRVLSTKQAGRMADALMIGHMGKGSHLVRAQAEYMKQRPHPYLQLVKAVLENNLLSENLLPLTAVHTAVYDIRVNLKSTITCQDF